MGTHPAMQVRLGRQTSHGDTSRNASEVRKADVTWGHIQECK